VKHRRWGQAVLAVLATVIALAVPDIARAAGTDGPWKITPQSSSSKCLDLPGSDTSDGTIVNIYTCHSGITPLNQRSTFHHWSDGSVYIINGASGKCLTTAGLTIESGAYIEDWPCAQANRWVQKRIETGAHDYYQFQWAGQQEWCINVYRNLTANNTHLILYHCVSGGAANDLFTWTPAAQ
jgi:hypothetical protein